SSFRSSRTIVFFGNRSAKSAVNSSASEPIRTAQMPCALRAARTAPNTLVPAAKAMSPDGASSWLVMHAKSILGQSLVMLRSMFIAPLMFRHQSSPRIGIAHSGPCFEIRLRNAQAECLGGFEVDHQLVFGRPLHWQIGRLLTLEVNRNLRLASLLDRLQYRSRLTRFPNRRCLWNF